MQNPSSVIDALIVGICLLKFRSSSWLWSNTCNPGLTNFPTYRASSRPDFETPFSADTHTCTHALFFFSIKVELSRHEKRLWKVNILLGNDKFCNGLIMFGVMVRAFTTRTPEVEADKSLWVCYLIYLESPDFQWFMHSATLSLKYKPELNKVSALYCALGSCEPGCCILSHHSLNLLLGVSCTSVSSYRDEESFLFIELLIF